MPSTATTWYGHLIDEAGNLLLQPPVGGFGHVRTHGARSMHRVALTFDDGPNAPSTADVLDILGTHGVKATFFCVGVNAARFPQLVERAFAEGHVIGNHSMYHSRKAGLLFNESAHLDDCTHVLHDIIGVTPRLYRPPWGWVTPWEMQRLTTRRFHVIGWDVYTYDWQVPPPDGYLMAEGVQRDARNGSIILFHDGIAGIHAAEKPQTVRAVERTIALLRADGFEFVTVAELLGLSPYVPDAGAKATGGCQSQRVSNVKITSS